MGNNYCLKIRGKVVSGNKKGQKIGFPTANLICRAEIDSGVYAGKVNVDNQEYRAGIIYFSEKNILEAHLMDFVGDLYGKEIEVEIGNKIRNIIKFKNEEELISQIKKDLELISS